MFRVLARVSVTEIRITPSMTANMTLDSCGRPSRLTVANTPLPSGAA